MDALAQDILREHAQLAADRANWENLWSKVAQRILPYSDQFNTERTPGQQQGEYVFDSTASLALDRFVASVNDMLTPAGRRWQNLVPSDATLRDNPTVVAYLEQVRDILFSVRYSPRAGFANNNAEVYTSLGAFGTGCLFIDEDKGKGLRYRHIHLGQIYVSENHQGVIDKVHRKFKYTARQALGAFGDKCPAVIKQAAEKEPERQFEFIHCVQPNAERDTRRADHRGMQFSSYYVSCDAKQVIVMGGYRTMPYIVSRYSGSLNSPYGLSVAIKALPDILMLNEMEKTIMRAGHLAVQPPLLTTEDGALSSFRMTPGAINSGALSDQGTELYKPLQMGSSLPLGIELSDQKRQSINDAFLVTIFQILVEEQRQMTATEIMQRAAEKGALLGPPMGRLQTEHLCQSTVRELDLLSAAGVLPPMPNELMEAGGVYEIEYSSELARMQKAGDGVAIQRTLEALTPLAQIDPKVLGVFNFEKTARELAKINGVPVAVLKTEEEMAQQEAGEAQAAQAAALLEAAPLAGKAAKDLAQAQSIAGAAPNTILPGIVG